MERAAWTDERLDDLAEAMRTGFARVDADLREIRGEINGLRHLILQVGGSIMFAILSVLAAILVRGA